MEMITISTRAFYIFILIISAFFIWGTAYVGGLFEKDEKKARGA